MAIAAWSVVAVSKCGVRGEVQANRGGFSGKQGIDKALKRLKAKMVYAGMEPVELVSCGGASLNLMGWSVRSTSDVDVIALRRSDGNTSEVAPGAPLPRVFGHDILGALSR